MSAETPTKGENEVTREATASANNVAHAYLSAAFALVLAIAVGLAAFALFARDTFSVGPAQVSASASPSLRPSTTIVVPPFGSIRADTHVLPIALRLSLEELDLPRLERLALQGVPDQRVIDGLISDVRSGFTQAMLNGLIAALLAGALVGWSVHRNRRWVLVSSAVSILVPALLVGATLKTLDVEAFEKPSFRGALSYAPSLIGLVESRARDIDSLRDQVGEMARDIARYYRSPQSFTSAGALEDTYRVLHVSDIHLDPVGLELAADLAKEFRASLVIDTGDINHYGSPTEAAMVAQLIPESPPRVFVPGNHESPAVVTALAGLPNVTVLREDGVTVDGVSIFGIADPASERSSADTIRTEEEDRAERAADTLARIMEAGGQTPDIIAMHNNRMVDRLSGLAPLLLAGHTHTPALRQQRGSLYLNSGTTGGIHFTRMRPEPHIPHSASVLYYTRDLPRRLIAIDQIEVFGLTGQSSLKRKVVDESLLR